MEMVTQTNQRGTTYHTKIVNGVFSITNDETRIAIRITANAIYNGQLLSTYDLQPGETVLIQLIDVSITFEKVT